MAAVIEPDRADQAVRRHGGIQQLDLRVEAAEVFGFLGPNGAGRRPPSAPGRQLFADRGRRGCWDWTRSPTMGAHPQIGYRRERLYGELTGAQHRRCWGAAGAG
jgi:hypothetical protein